MKKRSVYFLLAAVAAAAVLACFLWIHKKSDAFAQGPEETVLPEFPYSSMRPGDLAFRTGTGTYSRMLKVSSTDTVYYSHVGLLLQIDSQWVVIHAVPHEKEGPSDFERVKMETLDRFYDPSRALHGELVHTGFEAGDRMTEAALSFVRDSVRFDSSFDLSDSSRLYCTELPWLLYRREGIDISEGRRSHRGFPTLGQEGCISPTDIYMYSGNESYFKY